MRSRMKWKLVPVELTEEMADAAASRSLDDAEDDTNIAFYGNIFKAMLSAAPTPAEVEPVAWVEVRDSHIGPYEFHGIQLMSCGKHLLYSAPPSPADDYVLRETSEEVLKWLTKNVMKGPDGTFHMMNILSAALRNIKAPDNPVPANDELREAAEQALSAVTFLRNTTGIPVSVRSKLMSIEENLRAALNKGQS